MAKVITVQGFQDGCCELENGWDSNQQRCRVVATATKEIEMVTTHRANGKKAAKAWHAKGRAKRLLNLQRNREPLIPDKVLEKLAALNLPPNEWVYNVCLRELLRG